MRLALVDFLRHEAPELCILTPRPIPPRTPLHFAAGVHLNVDALVPMLTGDTHIAQVRVATATHSYGAIAPIDCLQFLVYIMYIYSEAL
jgi:uncharacterized ParB-like nuclease family protein